MFQIIFQTFLTEHVLREYYFDLGGILNYAVDLLQVDFGKLCEAPSLELGH
jgi:hypothetical protein